MRHLRPAVITLLVLAGLIPGWHQSALASLWPAVVALAAVILLRNAAGGLLAGGFSGALIDTAVEGTRFAGTGYSLFFRSIPENFYCLFTLALALLVAWRGWNPGPMARFERAAWESLMDESEASPAASSSPTLEPLLPLVIAAVFSGAVFGDHCSPFSDTTIVSAIACGIRPLDHVITQLPYALLSATFAAAAFLAAAASRSALLPLVIGTALLSALVIARTRRPNP